MTRRALILALVLAVCSCKNEPIAPDASSQLAQLAARYAQAHVIDLAHCPLEAPRVAPACEPVRTAGYDAEAEYTKAWSERTASQLAAAREKIEAYWRSTSRLEP